LTSAVSNPQEEIIMHKIARRMNRLVFTLVFASLVLTVCGQEPVSGPPDYKKIRKAILKEKSADYYPALMERYRRTDTSLTVGDYRLLYYGYIYQAGYQPYPFSAYTDSVGSILNRDTLNDGDFGRLIRYETAILEDCPFNLRDLNILGYAYARTGDTALAVLLPYRMDMIIRAILSTGDGKTEKTAFHVISISHEYDLLEVLGLKFGGRQMLTRGGCDYLEVQKNDSHIDGLYFDVNKILEKENEALKGSGSGSK